MSTIPNLLLAAILFVLYGQVLAGLAVDWWTDPTQAQGLLIPPLAVYIAWSRRHRLASTPGSRDSKGLVLVAAGCALFVLGKLAAEFFLWRMSFVVVLSGIVWTFQGARRMRVLAFPALLLATAIPMPSLVYSTLATPLQLLASDCATGIAQALGTVAYRDGNIIYLANSTLGVEEACSGLGSLSALIVASVLFGFSECPRWWGRLLVAALTFPISIGANVLRVAGTAVLADWNPRFADGFYHAFSGWLVFLCGFGLLYLAARMLSRWQPLRTA